MVTSPELPAAPGVADFDALQEDPARWIGVVAPLGARYSSAPAVPAGEGTVLVALLGRELVLKLYPPLLRDHLAFERAMLGHLQFPSRMTAARADSAEQSSIDSVLYSNLRLFSLSSCSVAGKLAAS